MKRSTPTPAPSDTVAITAIGIVSAAGHGVAATTESLRCGRSGLGPLTLFDSPECGAFPVAQVRDVERRPRTIALGRLALAEALAGIDPARCGLALGTTVGGMPESEMELPHFYADEPVGDDTVWRRHELGAVTAELAREFGLRGPRLTVNSACASGAEAIACAAEVLLDGEADMMVAGGADALCALTLNGFASLLAVDEHGCRPFDRDRGGMSLGEGAAFVVLERGADHPLALLDGWGNSCDAYHPTAPDPEGRGAEAAMRAALGDDLHVDYVNAHGTGTPDNDRAESRAIRRVFPDSVPPFSSTKRIFGHTLGAAGAIEAVVSVHCIRDGFLPANVGFQTPDPECGLVPLQTSSEVRPRRVLSHSFGFGGTNSVLCFRAPS